MKSSKKLALRKEVLGELRSDELAAVAGGTAATLDTCNPRVCVYSLDTCNVCINTVDNCLSRRVCVRTIQESDCVCVTH